MKNQKTNTGKLSFAERIEKKEQEIKQMQNEKKKLQTKFREEERKKRNKRLIEKVQYLRVYFQKAYSLAKMNFTT